MDLLRFITAGSVDDGKSTLIGRLLYDSKSILADQLAAIQRASKTREAIDLALVTDGLRAEREQGITIDVAYKYFSTPKRKFIIADAPGHVQYTRNMVTGASNSDLIIILVDARNGIVEQTRRHSIIASLLAMPYVVVAINKMDLVGYDQSIFDRIREEYAAIASRLSLQNVHYIPISALNGDNVVDRGGNMPWYDGKSLLQYLEDVSLSDGIQSPAPRFPVQYVIRPQTDAYHDYRGYAGKVVGGSFRQGDEVVVLPSGATSKIRAIEFAGKAISEAPGGQSVTMLLEDDVDVSRGDVIVPLDDQPEVSKELQLLVCWMGQKPLARGNRYLVQMHARTVPAIVQDVVYKVDVNTLAHSEGAPLAMNEIACVKIKTAAPVIYDSYAKLRANGGLIFIDETSNVTVGAGLIWSDHSEK